VSGVIYSLFLPSAASDMLAFKFLRPCSVGMAPFRRPIQTNVSKRRDGHFHIKNGGQRNRTIATEQGLS